MPLTSEPRSREYLASRGLRALVFGFFVSVLVVSLLINLIAFVWNGWVRQFFGGGEYVVQILFVGPTLLLVTAVFAKLIWDASDPGAKQIVRPDDEATHMEPTTHAEPKAVSKFDANPSSQPRSIPTGPTGPSGHGAPTGGWDNPKLP